MTLAAINLRADGEIMNRAGYADWLTSKKLGPGLYLIRGTAGPAPTGWREEAGRYHIEYEPHPEGMIVHVLLDGENVDPDRLITLRMVPSKDGLTEDDIPEPMPEPIWPAREQSLNTRRAIRRLRKIAEQKREAGVVVGNQRYPTDRESLLHMTLSITAGKAIGRWKDARGRWHRLTPNSEALSRAAEHLAACLERESELEEAIVNSPEPHKIDLTVGWPD